MLRVLAWLVVRFHLIVLAVRVRLLLAQVGRLRAERARHRLFLSARQ